MAAPAGAELFGGASAFQWAGLGIGALGALGGAAKAASAAPGQSSADAMFGSTLVAPDFSNWQVLLGGSQGTMTVGDKTGPVQAPQQNQEKVQASFPASTGYAASPGYGVGYGSTGATYQPNTATQAGQIPLSWLLIAGAVVLLWKKS